MKLIFMGTPDFAVPTLRNLVKQGHEICAVYTQPPRAGGRGLAARPSPVHVCALDLGLPVLTPERLRDGDAAAIFAALGADAAVVVAYGQILPQVLLDAPRHGCFNIHASLLPRWRGAAPIQRAIMAGDTETGISIMRMEAGLDTGPVCLQAKMLIEPLTTAGMLLEDLADLGAKMMQAVLANLATRPPDFTPQAAHGVTHAAKISKGETHIDFAQPAIVVRNHIHGLSPAPGAWMALGGARVRILQAVVETAPLAQPGEVLDAGLLIACGTDAVRPLLVQREGKGPMACEVFLRGHPVAPGTLIDP